jgi:hypothetical protein
MRNAMKKFWQGASDFLRQVALLTCKGKRAVDCLNFSSSEGLQQKRCSAALKPLKIAPLFPADFALHSTVFAMQRFYAVNAHRT